MPQQCQCSKVAPIERQLPLNPSSTMDESQHDGDLPIFFGIQACHRDRLPNRHDGRYDKASLADASAIAILIRPLVHFFSYRKQI